MDGLFELVDGKAVETKMSYLGGKAATRITRIVDTFIDANHLGSLSSETTYRCFPEKPPQTRRPDILSISPARVHLVPDEGHVPVAPDLAIEVVSPTDSVYELDDKLIDYRAAGIPLVWIINPNARTVKVYRPGAPIEELSGSDPITGGTVLPGFTIAEFFPMPPRLAKS